MSCERGWILRKLSFKKIQIYNCSSLTTMENTWKNISLAICCLQFWSENFILISAIFMIGQLDSKAWFRNRDLHKFMFITFSNVILNILCNFKFCDILINRLNVFQYLIESLFLILFVFRKQFKARSESLLYLCSSVKW